ncbi:MAG: hypothetical protein K0B15_09980 [Lentimicrobium sp.]|nr:hypothetical protein [Lentimicrobium sp.]
MAQPIQVCREIANPRQPGIMFYLDFHDFQRFAPLWLEMFYCDINGYQSFAPPGLDVLSPNWVWQQWHQLQIRANRVFAPLGLNDL